MYGGTAVDFDRQNDIDGVPCQLRTMLQSNIVHHGEGSRSVGFVLDVSWQISLMADSFSKVCVLCTGASRHNSQDRTS